MRKLLLSITSLVALSFPNYSTEQERGVGPEHLSAWGVKGAYYFAHRKGYDPGAFTPPNYSVVELPDNYTATGLDNGRNLGSVWGGAEVLGWFRHRITLPVIRGTDFLTSGNNLMFELLAELSPVTVGGSFSATFTPIAFFKLGLGGHLGTGWPLLTFNGVGLNQDGSGVPDRTAFSGVVARAWATGTLQFDLASVIPGEWTHVVAVASGKLEYQYFTNADSEEAWMYLNDTGENFNGFRYKGSYFLGYQMPLKVDTVGILVGTEENLWSVKELSTIASGGWGSDFREISIAPLMNIKVSDTVGVTILLEFISDKRATSDTQFNRWFQNRVYDSTYWRLDRLAVAWTVEL